MPAEGSLPAPSTASRTCQRSCSYAFATAIALLILQISPIEAQLARPQAPSAESSAWPEITVRTNFQTGSIGSVERLGPTEFRMHVAGQANESGRNRQATWFYFRFDGVRDRDLTVHLTDLVGEYNFKPGACAMNADTVPVFSEDGEHWQHFPSMQWDDARKEATLTFRSRSNSLWVAHGPPYPLARVEALLTELRRIQCVHISVLGQSVLRRDLHLVTITSPAPATAKKKNVWLIARQHAWETGTSFVMEGVLRFLTSDDPEARALRERMVFHCVPTMDPDGLALGHVRFNSLGYDLNRHWTEVEPGDDRGRSRMPEIACVKKALFAQLALGEPIDFLLNLHNTETSEYLESQADAPASQLVLRRFYDRLKANSTFDPSRELVISSSPPDTTNSLWAEHHILAALIEQRIGTSLKLGRRLGVADRLEFGKQLSLAMGHVLTLASTDRDSP